MILIAGGAGYIGSHVNKLLHARGYETVVLDNLVHGHREAVKRGTFVEGDCGDPAVLERVFSAYPITAVMHFAAYAYVGESVVDPQKYYLNNVAMTLRLLEVMMRHDVKRFIFSSSCATYGEPETMPITEEVYQKPVNPYGRTKRMVERVLEDYAAAYGLHFAALRYFNAAGDDPAGEIGEVHRPETHLIPLVLQAAAGQRESFSIYGTDYPTPDGTCIRDYVHVNDLADAHIRALEYIETEPVLEVNLGTANGNSIREILAAAEKVTGKRIPVKEAARRAGDPPELVGSYEKAQRLLGWRPTFDIEEILATAWRWQTSGVGDAWR